MSQSINLGWSCQRSKPPEKGNELVVQKSKIKPWEWCGSFQYLLFLEMSLTLVEKNCVHM